MAEARQGAVFRQAKGQGLPWRGLGRLGGEGLVPIYEIMILFSGLMVPVHIYGAWAKIQPITETLETGFWLATCLLLLACYPG